MRDELWNLIRLGQHQDDLQALFLGQHREELLQLVARLGIQSDKGILHDEHLGIGKQRCGQFVLAQLTT